MILANFSMHFKKQNGHTVITALSLNKYHSLNYKSNKHWHRNN